MTGRLKADVFRLSHPYVYNIPELYTQSISDDVITALFIYRHDIIIIIINAATVQGAGRVYIYIYRYPRKKEKKPETKLNNAAAACPMRTQFGRRETRPEHKSSSDHSR